MTGRTLRWPSARRIGIAAVVAVLLGLTAGGLAQLRVDAGISSFLPNQDPAYQALTDRARSFGGDPIVVLLESRQPNQFVTGQDKLVKLLGLEGRLAQLPDVAAVYGPGTVLNQIAKATQNLLAQISGRRDALQHEDAAQHGDAAVADFDRRYGALLVQGLPAGLPTLSNQRFVSSVALNDHNEPKQQWRFVLPNDHTVAVLVRPRENLDQDATGRLVAAVRTTVAGAQLDPKSVTVTGVPVLTAALTDRAQQELPVLAGIAVAAVGLIFFLVPWRRRRRARLGPVLTALLATAMTGATLGWLGVPVSLGVVAFLPILLGIGSDFPFYIARFGARRQVLVTALAAMVAFASLALSPLPFVRELGLSVALGIAYAVAIAVVLRRLSRAGTPEDPPAEARRGPRGPMWARVVAVLAAVGIAAVGWAALPSLAIEGSPEQLARGLPELAEARHAEDVLGSAGEVSIVLRGQDVLAPQALEWAEQAEQAVVLSHGDQMHPILTMPGLLGFLGKTPTADQIAAGAQLLPSYLTTAVIRSDHTSAILDFGVGLDDVSQQRRLFDQVRAALPPPPAGFSADLVGLPVAAARGLSLVSGERVLINVAGVVAACAVLAVGLRRRRDAARALLTVALATGWVLVAAQLVAGSLNPLTVAIGSLTTATGCEFAVMLAHARPGWRGVGTAALAGLAGYLVIGGSHIAVLRDFGLMLAASVALSFLAALLVRWVFPEKTTTGRTEVSP